MLHCQDLEFHGGALALGLKVVRDEEGHVDALAVVEPWVAVRLGDDVRVL